MHGWVLIFTPLILWLADSCIYYYWYESIVYGDESTAYVVVDTLALLYLTYPLLRIIINSTVRVTNEHFIKAILT